MESDTKQAGVVHLFAAAIIVVAVIAAAGWFVYHQQHKPSKITDAATKTQLQQAAAELKNVDLGSLAKSVNTVSNVQTNFNFKKANQ
jgi:uncharacterized protein HemX